jgi:hypothetical protein
MVQIHESLSQHLSGHGFSVTGSERADSRLAVQAPVSVLSERLSAADANGINPYRGYPRGLRAGRSVGSGGSLLSRRLSGQAGATCQTRGAKTSTALKQPATIAQRGVPVMPVIWCLGRMCRTSMTTGRQGPRTRPVI